MEYEKQLLQKQGYHVLKTLGSGGFGNVYLVFKQDIGIVAAKVMKEKDFDFNEWKVGLKLGREGKNPFVLKYISTTINEEFAIIIMEYANMKSLQNLIDKKKVIPLGIVRVIMRQI
ncbi:MAG: hypothetical protein EZS28_037711, partial [Streblomastix strix]